jgi:hypothetical protein
MCAICDSLKGKKLPLNPEETDRILDQVASRVREKPSMARHFDKVLDLVLGTEMTPRNTEAEEVFESNNRKDE